MNEHDTSDAEFQQLLDALATEGTVDAVGLSGAVAEIRSAFGPEAPPPVGIALSEFVDVSLIVDKGDLLATAASNANGPASQVAVLPERRDTIDLRSKKMISKVTAFVGTLAGKIVIGTTVAMAATGGVHAAGVVDIPVLPDIDSEEVAEDEADLDIAEESDELDTAESDADETDETDEADEPDDSADNAGDALDVPCDVDSDDEVDSEDADDADEGNEIDEVDSPDEVECDDDDDDEVDDSCDIVADEDGSDTLLADADSDTDSDEPDTDEPEGADESDCDEADEADTDEPEVADEADTDEPEVADEADTDEPEEADEPDTDEPEEADEPDTDEPETDSIIIP